MKLYHISFALLLSFFSVGIINNSANAEIVPYDRERAVAPASTVENVGLAFLRVAKADPDFISLARKTAEIRNIPSDKSHGFVQNEALRIQSQFSSFNPAKDVITLRVDVKINYVRNRDKTARLKIKYPSKGIIYFPYYYADYPIAVIVNDLELFQDMTLSEEETAIASARLNASGKATLLLQLNPLSADVKTPLKLDNMLQYPFLCKIGFVGLFNENAGQIWAWETPENAKRAKSTRNLSSLGMGQAAAP